MNKIDPAFTCLDAGSMRAAAKHWSCKPLVLHWFKHLAGALTSSFVLMQPVLGKSANDLLADFQKLCPDAPLTSCRDTSPDVNRLVETATFSGEYSFAESLNQTVSLEQYFGAAPIAQLPPIEAIADASSFILERTLNQRAVFFNEDHRSPETRVVLLGLLPALRAQGFTHLAIETLVQDSALAKRGFPLLGTGYYTDESIYGEMVRQGLKLGFQIVPYEAIGGPANGREKSQAQNLFDRVFKGNPNARLIVNAGFGHIYKKGQKIAGSPAMAEDFVALTGIEPLAVEQTMMIPRKGEPADDLYRSTVRRFSPTNPSVLLGASGKPWTFAPGAIDIVVLFPPSVLAKDRPSWVALSGWRTVHAVHRDSCQRVGYPCMVEARYLGEPIEAVPADRLILWNSEDDKDLYLPAGGFSVRYTGKTGDVVDEAQVTVFSW